MLLAIRLMLITGLFIVSTSSLAETLKPIPAIDISGLDEKPLREPALFWATDQDISVSRLPLESFQALTPEQLNRGITDDYHWIRVRLSNTAGKADRHWVLRHETSYLDELDVYFADNAEPLKWISLSDRVPFQERPVQYRTLAFEHITPAGGFTDLLLRLHYIKADTLTLNFFLSDASLFHEGAQLDYLVYGSYYGLMLSLLAIALIFAGILRQVIYLHYAVFLGFSILMWAQLNGLAFQYLWPDSPFWHNEGFNIIFLLMAMTALQFSRGFLKVAQYFPFIDKIMRASQWLMAIAILLRLSGVYGPVLLLSHLSLASLLLLAPLGYMAYRRGLHYARWYSAAWVFYGIGLMVSVLSASSAVFSWGMTPLAYAQAGGVLEAVCLMVALGEKLIGWDRDRRLALKVANQDPLTGLGNRRALQEAFDELQESTLGRRLPAFLILIDLDHFKAINDRYGHDAGDAVLRDFSRLLQRAIRPEDACARFGGEEFAILLQAPALRYALEIAERIRSEFASTATAYQGKDIAHTLSAGVAEIKTRDTVLGSELIRQADWALYESKNAGRNCIRVYHQGPIQPHT